MKELCLAIALEGADDGGRAGFDRKAHRQFLYGYVMGHKRGYRTGYQDGRITELGKQLRELGGMS